MLSKQDISMQTLRVPAGWKICKNIFYDVQPDPELKIEGMTNDEVWFLFEQELLFAEFENPRWILDMGWTPDCDPSGEFHLRLVKEDYRTNEPIAICKTKDKNEIVEAINQTMARISRGNEDNIVNEPPLMPLKIHSNWKVVHNEFYDMELSEDIDYLKLLKLETHPKAIYKIDLTWATGTDSVKQYIARLVDNNGEALVLKETAEINEVPGIIDQLSRHQDRRPKRKKQ
jgi:hypothetical protein